jgi:NAD(P)-dependent dehydrogenase (short-subunit alcohol dehydrogenase family)
MKTALVTGAASGIGHATAETFAAEGWQVYATDVDTDRLESLEGCTTARLDVTETDDVEGLRDRIDAEAGGLDCLVANAGFAQLGPLGDLPTDRLEDQFAVNVHGVHRTVRTLLPLLTEREGTVAVVSSTHGRITTPGMGAYAASKHAVEALGETLRMELADVGVDVALIEPGWVETELFERHGDRLAGSEGSGRFEAVDDAMAEGTLVRGGPLAIPPERVAATIEEVATAEEPGLRNPVGWQARVLLGTRWLPWPVRSAGQRAAVELFAALHRLGGRD